MKVEDRHDKFLALTLLARKTLVLILSSAMVVFFFQKVDLQGLT